jgi:hypothetical protein
LGIPIFSTGERPWNPIAIYFPSFCFKIFLYLYLIRATTRFSQAQFWLHMFWNCLEKKCRQQQRKEKAGQAQINDDAQ